MSSRYLILVAAGSSRRMKNDLPKQFMKLKGKEIVWRCAEKFRAYDRNIRIIITVNRQYREMMESVFRGKMDGVQICEGGETRFHSVKNALQLIHDEDSLVGIHDAARPFVAWQTIANCFDEAEKTGNAIPVVRVNDTLRHLHGNSSHTVPRSEYFIVQTPQCFQTKEIKQAFEQAYSERFTDDATVLEFMGKNIHLVEGNPENIKITYPHDMIIANALADAEQ